MPFTHDTEVALAAMAALVNSPLEDRAALDVFAATRGWTGADPHDEAELAAVRALRTRLRRLWELSVDDAVALVNDLLREGHALPQLVRHDGWDYHLHATTSDATPAQRLGVEAAMAMIDVIRAKELDRLRVCAADDCDDVMVDLSKNRSRRFCDATCANRVNVAAFRARRSSSGAAGRAPAGRSDTTVRRTSGPHD